MKSIRVIDIRVLGKKRTGDEAVFFNLTKELLALDQEHDYRLLTDERDPEQRALLAQRLGCAGQKNVQLVPLFGRNRFLWNLFSLPWFLLWHRVDTFHTQYILPAFVPKRTKVLLHIHDVSFRAYPRLIGWPDRVFLNLLLPHALRRADCILTPSHFTKEEVTRYYGTASDKIAVIPNALSGEFLQGDQGDLSQIRNTYRLPERFILFVGTLQPRKNVPLLIRAFAGVRQQLPGLELVLVGSRTGHHFDPAIDQAISELGVQAHVHFPGYVATADLPGVIRLASLFAFPSLYEGFGIPLLEAMSQGVPVAASDIPCFREVAAQAAQYFDPTSIASCQEKLYTLLTQKELRDSGISLGKDRLALYSWKKSAESLLALYSEKTLNL